jgi:hypothetical protein
MFGFAKTITTLAAVAIGVVRPWLVAHELPPHLDATYQAAAHLLVGGLVGAAIIGGRKWDGFGWAVWLIVILSAIEVICAVATVLSR